MIVNNDIRRARGHTTLPTKEGLQEATTLRHSNRNLYYSHHKPSRPGSSIDNVCRVKSKPEDFSRSISASRGQNSASIVHHSNIAAIKHVPDQQSSNLTAYMEKLASRDTDKDDGFLKHKSQMDQKRQSMANNHRGQKSPRKASDILREQLDAIKQSHQKANEIRKVTLETDKKLVDDLAAFDQLAAREAEVRKGQIQRELRVGLDNMKEKPLLNGDDLVGLPLKHAASYHGQAMVVEKRTVSHRQSAKSRPEWFC